MRKEFDIKYKDDIIAGRVKVVTRDGCPVRIICWDFNNYEKMPIVALYECKGEEHLTHYTEKGKIGADDHKVDLFLETKDMCFNSILRLIEMLAPSERAKSYCEKLAVALENEGYGVDARLVRERIKMMNGERVGLATQDSLYSKLESMLDEALSKETMESWNEFLNERELTEFEVALEDFYNHHLHVISDTDKDVKASLTSGAQVLLEIARKNHLPAIQWTGDNLGEVLNFTGKDERFYEWFKNFEEYQNYVKNHRNIFKIFLPDSKSHYECEVGCWIVKLPEGTNYPLGAKFIE